MLKKFSKIVTIILVFALITTPVDAAVKKQSIDKIGKDYVVSIVTQKYDYQSYYELLENNNYKVTKKNLKDIKASVKKYDKISKIVIKYRKGQKKGYRYESPAELLQEAGLKADKASINNIKYFLKILK